MESKKLAQDDPAQSQRFIDMAHEVEVENEPAVDFDALFNKVSTLKPSPCGTKKK